MSYLRTERIKLYPSGCVGHAFLSGSGEAACIHTLCINFST